MNTSKMTDREIRDAGWQALVAKLGPSGAVRFAIQTERGSGDYAAMRDDLLGSATVDELMSRMRAHQATSPSRPKKVKAAGALTRRPRAPRKSA